MKTIQSSFWEKAEAGSAYLRFRVGKDVEADLLKEMIGFLVEKRMVRWLWAEYRPLVSFLSVSRPGPAPKSIQGGLFEIASRDKWGDDCLLF